MSRTTIVDLVLLAVSLTFAVLGFVNASNSYIPPTLIALSLAVSALVFGVLALRGLRRPTRWQRFAGLAATLVALLMLGFAIYAYRLLGPIIFVY